MNKELFPKGPNSVVRGGCTYDQVVDLFDGELDMADSVWNNWDRSTFEADQQVMSTNTPDTNQ